MTTKALKNGDNGYYRIPHPGLLWNGEDERESAPLPEDGGRQRLGHMCKSKVAAPKDVTNIETVAQSMLLRGPRELSQVVDHLIMGIG